ncbi:type IX secretion system protein PorD [Nonlabens xiamenensis]|uniref:type IX secretion system protein PorD n=1 Tax=Nonlabens xiamenensis TaxID=2341043 RepID=UPI000F613B8A|nr:DUF4835 family protein [Nonlabens xiamenensis]
MKLLNKWVCSALVLFGGLLQAQELNMTVQVNAQNVAQPDQSIFKTLETSMQEFLNNTKWTDQKFKEEERINASLVFVVTSYDNDRFQGNFQVSVSRPVYNATYTTPIFNYKDNDIAFEYIEYAPLFYNANQYENNLISLITFYAYTILGLDGDTFSYQGGQEYHLEARNIVNLAQSNQGAKGWKPNDGLISRYRLNDDMLSDTYKEYRQVMYDYHLKGLDTFAKDPKAGKILLQKHIAKLEELNNRRPNSLLQRIFFDAKADEIVRVYSSGPTVDIRTLKNLLQKLAPNQSSKWRNIKV